MSPQRPDPDIILKQIQEESHNNSRGKLKIFFGYAAGVGKTYAMLEAAHKAKQSGRDVVVGYVEPHGRKETESLLVGLEAIPNLSLTHNGITLFDLDINAALLRKPQILLVDELAHSNPQGARHIKRWQDVFELLDSGINVWTTLNVQHIESLNDVIGQITGTTVRETVPDDVLQQADQLELVDISPDELVERIQQGKVYMPAQAERAIRNFFQHRNLIALRELSLRQAAKRIHSDVESERRQQAANPPWATNDRLLVCVGPSPTTARVIRTAKQMADALDSPWTALCVEITGIAVSPTSLRQVGEHFRLAERLGAETVTVTGDDVARSVLDYARRHNVTKILIGKSGRANWTRWFHPGIVDELLENSGPIDLYVIQGGEDKKPAHILSTKRRTIRWGSYGLASGLVSLLTACLSGLSYWFPIADANIVMLYLAGVTFIAFRLGRGPAIWASFLSVLIFDIYFVPPRWSLTVYDSQYIVTFAVMMSIGWLISTLTSRLQAQLVNGSQREHRTQALYRLGKQLSALSGRIFLVTSAAKYLRDNLDAEIVIYLRKETTRPDASPVLPVELPEIVFGKEVDFANQVLSLTTAHWVMTRGQFAGMGTDTLPTAPALFIPLAGTENPLGAIAIRSKDITRLLQPEQRNWLENCANQLALALERDRLTLEASDVRLQAESESIRNTLLSGVSHDLRTPLAAITGAGTTLLQISPALTDTQQELLRTITEEAARLNQLVDNILQISRLDSGSVNLNKQWHLLEEIIGSAIRRTKWTLGSRTVTTDIPVQLPLIHVDGLLLEQVFVNLLENAARHTPPTTQIKIEVKIQGKELHTFVTDTGPGIPAEVQNKVFEKFFRSGTAVDDQRGSGLGLAICRAIVQLHDGQIRVRNRSEGGAEFLVLLPLSGTSPQITIE